MEGGNEYFEKVQWVARIHKGNCSPDTANKIGLSYWMMKGSCRAFGKGQVNLRSVDRLGYVNLVICGTPQQSLQI